MTIVEAIKGVAKFAGDDTNQIFANIVFDKGRVWAQGPQAGAVAATPGLDISIASPAHKVVKALQAMGKRDPEFTVDGARLRIQGDGKASVEGTDVKNQPKIYEPPEKGWIKVKGMSRVPGLIDCVSKDTTRRHLSGIHLAGKRAEATDGHGMMILELEVDGELPNVIVTPQAVLGIPDECWMALDGGRLFIADNPKAPAYRFARIVDVAFPPVDQVVQSARCQGTCRVNREAFADVLKRARISAKLVKLQVAGAKLTVEVDEGYQTLFAFASSVPIEHGPTPVPPGIVGFDSTLLVPMVMEAKSEQIELWLTPSREGGLDPLMLQDGPYTAVLMPYRL